MIDPDFLLHQKYEIAFEEIVKAEAQKFIKRTPSKKFFDKAKPYAFLLAVPNAIAGSIGFATGGLEGAIEAMQQVSTSVIPYSLIFQRLNESVINKQPLDNINYVFKNFQHHLKKYLKFIENPQKTVIYSGIQTAFTASVYFGLSLLSEVMNLMDSNQGQMALTGAGVGLLTSGVVIYQGHKLKKKVIDYANDHVKEIEKKKGTVLELDDLEEIVRGALKSPEQTHKIYLASNQKRFMESSGPFGFLGFLDELVDRDLTRLKPNLILYLNSSGSKSPKFSFEYKREKSKTDTILDVLKTIYTKSNDLDLKISPYFNNTSLENILRAPYEQLSFVYIYGKSDNLEYFKIHYNFSEDVDEIAITVNSRQHLSLVLDLFNVLYGRDIEDIDFDEELIQMAGKEKLSIKSDVILIPLNIEEALSQLNIDPKKFNLDDPLNKLKPIVNANYPSLENDKDEQIIEPPEQPLSNLFPLSQLVNAIYKTHKDKIQYDQSQPSLNIAFPGMVYSLFPIHLVYKEKNQILRAISCAKKNPLGSLKSLITDGEIIPSLDRVALMTQLSGISKDNVYDVIRELENQTGKLQVHLNLSSMDYNSFWQISNDSIHILDHSYSIDVISKENIIISLYFKNPIQSYKKIRDSYFLTGDLLKVKAEQDKVKREINSVQFGKFDIDWIPKSRFEKEIDNSTYMVVEPEETTPEHIIMYKGNDKDPFMADKTVYISTENDTFIGGGPVHPNQAIKCVTDYFIKLRDVIKKVNSN